MASGGPDRDRTRWRTRSVRRVTPSHGMVRQAIELQLFSEEMERAIGSEAAIDRAEERVRIGEDLHPNILLEAI